MSEEVEIEIVLSSDWHERPPTCQVSIDDTVISNLTIVEKKEENNCNIVKWKGMLSEGDHFIKIKYFGKTNQDTVIDPITKEIKFDQLLHVDSVSIDQIDIGFLTYKLSKFYPDRTIRPDLDEILPQKITTGFNGEWQLMFQVPTYLWLLENF